jgi:HlyD family secretion protein
MEEKDIELKHDQVNEILSAPPAWTIRWGSLTILAVLVLIIVGSIYIRYPTLITCRVNLTSSSLPAAVKPILHPDEKGEIEKVLVSDRQTVSKDDILVVLESSGTFEDIEKAHNEYKGFLNNYNNGNLTDAQFDRQLNLGPMQNSYARMLSVMDELKLYAHYNLYGKGLNEIKKQYNLTQGMKSDQEKNIELLRSGLKLSKSSFERDSGLYVNKVISLDDFEKSKSRYLKSKSDENAEELKLVDTELQLEKLQQAISMGTTDSLKSRSQLQVDLYEARMQYENDFNQWESAYLLKAPINGTANFVQPLQPGQTISSDKDAIIIIPKADKLFAYTYVSSNGAGKIKPGQTVNIRFDGFPYQEYGIIKGTVENVSKVSVDGNYYVTISMPQTLVTNFGKRILFTQNMQGSASIVTEDMSFLKRVFFQLRSIFNNSY